MSLSCTAVTVRDALRLRRGLLTPPEHLLAAIAWLRRAQDAVDGGVSYGYALHRPLAKGRGGWLAAYPETTGYIICTFLDHFAWSGDTDSRDRALRLADWEVYVQMDDGAVRAGPLESPPEPAIFNTGQVLFGWIDAYQASGKAEYVAAAGRAADFLLRAQDADGAWRLGSPYARPGGHTYDARAAWGLLEAARITGSADHAGAAMRNLDFAVSQQRDNGWFAECCIIDPDRPLLHTIAYAIEGLLGAGVSTSEARYVEAARRAADALLGLQRPDGSLAGRFDSSWRPAARWECLTGSAQTCLAWLRLFELTGEHRYRVAAGKGLAHICRTQDLAAVDPGIRGGVKGSEPIWGRYQGFAYPNWATKFFADAMLLFIAQRQGSALGAADAGPGVSSTPGSCDSGPREVRDQTLADSVSEREPKEMTVDRSDS